MFTSRAEFRLCLRPDNADLRLTEKGYKRGCVSKTRYEKTLTIKQQMEEAKDLLRRLTRPVRIWRERMNLPAVRSNERKTAFEMLGVGNADITVAALAGVAPELEALVDNPVLARRLQIEALYDHALKEQAAEIEEMKADECLVIPRGVDYNSESLSMSLEEREKLAAVQPSTVSNGGSRGAFVCEKGFSELQIAAASRIPGVSPSSVFRLLRYVKQTAVNR